MQLMPNGNEDGSDTKMREHEKYIAKKKNYLTNREKKSTKIYVPTIDVRVWLFFPILSCEVK